MQSPHRSGTYTACSASDQSHFFHDENSVFFILNGIRPILHEASRRCQ